jgi:hypothetical protein
VHAACDIADTPPVEAGMVLCACYRNLYAFSNSLVSLQDKKLRVHQAAVSRLGLGRLRPSFYVYLWQNGALVLHLLVLNDCFQQV